MRSIFTRNIRGGFCIFMETSLMDKKKLKETLHRQIDELDDEMALQMLHEAVAEYGRIKEGEPVDELTPAQLKRLDESLDQLDNGQWKSHEEVMKLSRSWLIK